MSEDNAESEKKKNNAEKPETAEIPAPGGDDIEYEPIPQEGIEQEKKAPAAPQPHHEEDKGLKNKLKKKESEIKALKKENDELKDRYLRALAEMENLRKRLEKERTEFQQYALSDFLMELLGTLDNFERALVSRDQSDGKSFQEGVEMIYRQLLDMLKKKGISPIEIKEKEFDPNVHQAVLTEESEDVEEPEVAEELQRGYRLHGRLLRPALVKVLIPKKKEES